MKKNKKIAKGPTLMDLFLQKGWTLVAKKSSKGLKKGLQGSDLNGSLLFQIGSELQICSEPSQNQPITFIFSPAKSFLGLSNQSKRSILLVWHSKNQVANSTLLTSYEH